MKSCTSRRPVPSRVLACFVSVIGLSVAAGLVAPSAAEAQMFGYSWMNKKQADKKKQRVSRSKSSKEKAKPPVVVEKQPNGPLVLTVSLKAQRVKVFDADGLVAEAPISSGRVGNATPTGVFTILGKSKMHYSNLYGNAPMPNMQRITWSGVALHAGVLPGYPASHGCIRLPHSFSRELYGLTKLGQRVIVARDTLEPQSIKHEKLFTAFAEEMSVTTGSTAPAAGTTTVHHAMGDQVADASGTSVPSASPSAVLGVTRAEAAEVAPPASETAAPVTNPYREKWNAEMARIAAAVPAAEAAKAEAAEALPAVTKAADEAKAALKAARVEAAKAAAARKKAEGALAAADRALVAFAKKMMSGKKLSEEAATKLVGVEDKLEADITDTTKALEEAKAEESRTAALLKSAEEGAASADASRKAAVNKLAAAEDDLKKAIEANASAKRREAKRDLPVSVFVSRKTKKIYVRQGYEPVLELPVAIAEPDKPLGTHVFTALALEDNKTDFKWSVVSVPTVPAAQKADTKSKKKSKEARKEEPAPKVDVSDQTPERALERITIPLDAREQIADVMKPGSSLLISDNGLSNETGKYTDFIVSLH